MKIFIKCLFAAAALMAIPQVSYADGWGNTGETVKVDGDTWDKMSLGWNGLNFTSLLPNYQSGRLQNGTITLFGQGLVEGKKPTGYMISTPVNGNYKLPAKIDEFVRLVKRDNSSFQVIVIDNKQLLKASGAKYIVDLVPNMEYDGCSFFRFFAVADRVVQMGTNDSNAVHRKHFFESIRFTK